MADMAQAGAVAFSDDGQPVESARLMRHALEYSRVTGRPIVDHCRRPGPVDGGVDARGPRSPASSGCAASPPRPRRSPSPATSRWPALTGGRLHIAHVSTAAAVDLSGAAKTRGVAVTAEVTPHHLLMTDEWVAGYGRRDAALQHQLPGEPAAADGRRPRGAAGRAARRHHRLHRDRPRAAHQHRQGLRVRPGGAWASRGWRRRSGC